MIKCVIKKQIKAKMVCVSVQQKCIKISIDRNNKNLNLLVDSPERQMMVLSCRLEKIMR